MGQFTVSDLLNASTLAAKSADSWGQYLVGVEQNASYLNKTAVQPLGNTWTGTAAQLAQTHFEAIHGGLIENGKQLAYIQGQLNDFSSELAGYSQELETQLKGAAAAGLDVGQDGTVSVPAADEALAAHNSTVASQLSQLRSQANSYQTEIQGLLTKANAADSSTAANLEKYMPSEGGHVDTTTPWSSTYSSLWQIAQKEYGDGSKWKIIYDANRSLIGSNPNVVDTGVNLQIPALANGTAPAPPSSTPAPSTHTHTTPTPARTTPATPIAPATTPQKVEPHAGPG
jgi:hypothetical protein